MSWQPWSDGHGAWALLGGLIGFLALLGGCAAGEPGREPSPQPPAARVLGVAVLAPDAGWSIRIEEVWDVDGSLWVFSRLSRPPDVIAAQVLTTVRDEVTGDFPAGAVRHLVAGKTWAWANDDPVEFVRDDAPVFRERERGRKLWPAGNAGG